MRFIFDTGLIITSSPSDYMLGMPISGLGMPPIRTSTSDYSGRDGGLVEGGQYFSGRQISIPGYINYADDCDDHNQQRIALVNYLPKNEDIGLEIELASTSIFTTVRVLDVQMDYDDLKASKFKIDLYAGDPLFYTGDEFEVEMSVALGGGAVLPFVLPVVLDPSSGAVVVNNDSAFELKPTFTLSGEFTNPVIRNTATSEYFSLDIITSPGDEIVISTNEPAVTLNGSSIMHLIEDGSTWFTLAPGDNTFILETDDSDDSGTATVTWRNAVASA